jgi:hypothetical protein
MGFLELAVIVFILQLWFNSPPRLLLLSPASEFVVYTSGSKVRHPYAVRQVLDRRCLLPFSWN